MKIHKQLKELLLDYENEKDNLYNRPVGIDEDDEMFINSYVSNNSLALGKQKPLAKNKQFVNVCYHQFFENITDVNGCRKCINCGKLQQT